MMKPKLTVKTVLIGAALLAGLTTCALAQQGNPSVQEQRPQGPPAVMKAGANGAFVLQGGTLTKYSTSLQQTGQVTLVEPPAAPSAQGQNQEQGPGRPPMGPPPPGGLLVAGDAVLVIVGDSFFHVNATTLATTAKATLPTLAPPPAPGNGQQGQRGPGGAGGQRPQGAPGGQRPQGGPGGQGQQDGQRPQGGPGGQGGPGMQGGDQGGPSRPQGPMPGMMPPPPLQMELSGRTLFVVRGPQLLAINIDTGAVATQTTGADVTLN